VHHGDPGALLTFLSHGVPQVVLPHSAEETRMGAALADSRAGMSLPEDCPLPEVGAAVRTVLDDGDYAAAAAGLAEEMRAMPSPVDLAARVESLLPERAPTATW
jgi:UDP:flavonoid glycosyltransferase YjiC (YdhE family)